MDPWSGVAEDRSYRLRWISSKRELSLHPSLSLLFVSLPLVRLTDGGAEEICNMRPLPGPGGGFRDWWQ